ncbi:MAG: TetR/AcrR family transcriptional regulator [Solirubrobacteraceae bacterium]
MAEAVAQDGFAATTVAGVVARAGVSRKAFYEHFRGKEECFLAVYDEIVADGITQVSEAYRAGEGLEGGAHSGIEVLFERAVEKPGALRLVLVEIGALGSAGVERRERLIGAYEQLLRRSLDLPRGSGPIPNPVLRAIVGGLSKVLYTYVSRKGHGELRSLIPDLVEWVTSYFPVPEAMMTLTDPPPSTPAAAFAGGRAPGTLAPESTLGVRRAQVLRHARISRSFVVHSQRERILDAVANLSATRGFAAFTVNDVADEAAVSLKAFYEHFADKEDAFLVAYEVGHGKGLSIVQRAFQAAPDWPAGVIAGIAALFDFLAAEPSFAYMALVDALTATPRTAERSNQGIVPYAQMLLPGLDLGAPGRKPATVAIEAIAGGLFELCFSYALQRRVASLSELAPRATYFALAPFLGAQRAGELAVGVGEGS